MLDKPQTTEQNIPESAWGNDWAQWVVFDAEQKPTHQKEFVTSYEELDRSKIRELQMHHRDGRLLIAIPFKEGQGGRLIWRRRVQMHSDGTSVVFYIVGKRGAFVAMLFENGAVAVDDSFQEGHALYGEIDPVKGEENVSIDQG